MFTKNKKVLTTYKRFTAFTLAETLLTLAIVGVIAALVLPSLISKTQNQEYVTGLKKAYAVGNAAFQKAALDYCGTADLSCLNTNLNKLGNAIASEYNVSKNCYSGTGGGCFSKFNYSYDGSNTDKTMDPDNNIWTSVPSGFYKFITNDGMTIAIATYQDSCTTDYGLNSNSPTTKSCGFMSIDVNGLKGPNYQGRDVFTFSITSNKAPLLYPKGGKEDNFSTNSTNGNTIAWSWWNNGNNFCSSTNSAGSYCAGRVMEKGWVMDY